MPQLKKIVCLTLSVLYTCLNYAQVTADFTASPSSGCSPVTVYFKDASTGGAVNYLWDFGNGNTSIKQNPSAIFIKPGFYTITLTVRDGNGVKSDEVKSKFIQVFKNPTADLNASKLTACKGETIQFTDKSTQGDAAITSWKWDFGDGTVSYSQNPSHSYTQSGTYTIRLVVKDANGCEHSVSFTNYIHINADPNSSFTIAKDYHCTAPHTTSFSAKGGTSLNYSWNFDDGNTGVGPNPSNTFSNKGTYQVSLTATDANGCKSTTTIPLTVDDLKANFTSQRSTVCKGEYVQLIPQIVPNIQGASFEWDLGDGAKKNTTNVSHKYKNSGLYSITLKVIAAGCTATITKPNFAEVRDLPRIKTRFSDSVLCDLNEEVTFSELNPDGDNVSWKWEFTEGSEVSNQSGKLGFKARGHINYTLTVKDRAGCENKETGSVKISDLNANFTPSDDAFDSFENRPIYGGCKPYTLTLKERISSSFGKKNITWDMGLGPIQTGNEGEKTYDESQWRYHGFLSVEDNLGCKDSIDFYVQEGEKVFPDFSPKQDVWCNGDTIQFRNHTQPIDSVDRFYWSFGRKEFEPKYNVNRKPDTFSITLSAYVNGCRSDTTHGTFVVLAPYAKILPEDDTDCFKDSVIFNKECIDCDSIAWYINDTFYSNEPSLHLAASTVNKVKLKAWNFSTGCDHEDELSINLSQDPKLVVNWPNIDTCAPLEVNFSATAQNGSNYTWYINGADSFNLQNLYYTFTEAGDYQVKLKAETYDGCEYFQTRTFEVPGISLPSTVIHKDTCLPFGIQLHDSGFDSRTNAEAYWLINDKDTFRHSKAYSTYTLTEPSKGGMVHIKLVGASPNGCSSEKEYKVPASAPFAEVKQVLDYRCDHIYSTFDIRNKQGNIILQNWKMNGKVLGVFDRLVTNLPYDVNNKVSLLLVDENKCRAEITTNIFQEKYLKAKFTADTTGSFCPPLEVKFEDLSSFARPIIRYEWDFGDGSSSELQHPKKIYLNPGKYSVKLAIQDKNGCWDTAYYPDFIIVNGPHGEYSFTPSEGCTPLNVDFSSKTTNASIIKWDIGDGVTLDGAQQNYTYTRVGQYIPLLILEDSLGCKYTMPPKDTIHVHGNPLAKFNHSNPCFGEEVFFSSDVDTIYGSISSYKWKIGNATLGGKDTSLLLATNKTEKATLTVVNKHQCVDSLSKTIKLYEPIARFNLNDTQFCVGQRLETKNLSTSDTTIVSYNWNIGDWAKSAGHSPTFILDKLGDFPIKLVVVDAAGCTDSIVDPSAFGVGDTNAPQPPFIHRVSVLNDNAIDVTFNKDSIADFFRYELFRDIGSGSFVKVGEQTAQNDTLIIDNNVLTLHTPHCYVINKENFCNVKTKLSELERHCTVEATATGVVNAITVDWNHYIGWNEIDSYYVYRREKAFPFDYQLIGQVDGQTLKYTDTVIYCRNTQYYRILAKQKSMVNTQWSWSDTTAASPIYINEVPPNEIWRVSVEEDDYNLIEWLPVKGSKFPIDHYKLYVKEANGGYKLKWDSISPTTDFIENFNTEVDDYNYFYKMRAVDVCDDISDFSQESKTILLKAEMNEEFRPHLHWTKYQGWAEGVDEYIVEFQNMDGSFTEIGRTWGTDTTFDDEVSPFNCIENYCYRVTATRNQPMNYPDSAHDVISHSNVDCAPLVSKLFVPNAFTLNGDGLNDDFTVKGIYIKEYNIKIFTRWGEKVYDSDSFKIHWDGIFGNLPVAQNVFVYLIEARGVDEKIYRLHGDVTVLK